MTRTPSTMVELGTQAPGFKLPDQNPATDMGDVSLDTFEDADGYLVMFLCNHCPYVKHIEDKLAEVADELADRGIAAIGISSNDIAGYPDDDPEGMAAQAKRAGFTFPYLFDESQEVAKAYRAACTPDLFLFDGDRELFYRGQFDGSRPGNDVAVTGEDLQAAAQALLAGDQPPAEQAPSAGCNIKWAKGSEPAYF